MRAVDTNVLVRFLTRDDLDQAQRALDLLRNHAVWIAKTVLLETEWVLRSLYEFDRKQIAEGLEKLLGLPDVHVEDPRGVRNAMSWFAGGMDLADAMHLASSGSADTFVTLDDRFRSQASRLTGRKLARP